MPATLDLGAAEAAAANDPPETPDVVASTPDTSAPAATPDPTPQATPTPAAQAQPTPAQEAWSLRSELQRQGLQGDWQDDKAAWNHVQTALQRQQQEYAEARQLAQYYLANRDKFEAALKGGQPQPAAQPQPEAAKPAWQAPEWNPEYERFLTTDDKGNVVAVPGADPTLPMKYQQYRGWQKQTLEKLVADPAGTLGPVIQPMIEKAAQEMIQRHLGQYDDRNFASKFVAESADWMYEKGPNGQRAVHSLTGQPLLSAAGQKFATNVQMLDQLGVRDVRVQQDLAEKLTKLEALNAWYAQTQLGGNPNQPPAAPRPTPDQTNAALKAAAVAGKGANRLPASGAQGGAGPAAGVGDPRPQDIRLSLADRLTKKLREAGVN